MRDLASGATLRKMLLSKCHCSTSLYISLYFAYVRFVVDWLAQSPYSQKAYARITLLDIINTGMLIKTGETQSAFKMLVFLLFGPVTERLYLPDFFYLLLILLG
jgi:hypothetical protein